MDSGYLLRQIKGERERERERERKIKEEKESLQTSSVVTADRLFRFNRNVIECSCMLHIVLTISISLSYVLSLMGFPLLANLHAAVH